MKVVKIEVLPAHDNEVVTAVITEETNKGGSWKEGSKNTVKSGTPEATRTMLLDDDDRVIIEGKVEAEVELDHEQRAAKVSFRGDKRKEQEEKDKKEHEKFEKMQKDEKERLEREKPQEAKLREEQMKARDEKIMGKQEVPEEKKYREETEKAKGRPDFDDAARRPNQPPQDQRGGSKEEAPSTGPGRDSGLREEVPMDSKTVTDHGSTTKGKK